jgi:hypothetical protein
VVLGAKCARFLVNKTGEVVLGGSLYANRLCNDATALMRGHKKKL